MILLLLALQEPVSPEALREFAGRQPKERRAALQLCRELVVAGDSDDEWFESCRGTALYLAWGKPGFDELRSLLADADPEIRRNAACTLARMGHADGRELLVFRDGDSWLRRVRVATALASLDPKAGLLDRLLTDEQARVRAAGVTLLEDRARWIRMLADPSERVFRAVRARLGRKDGGRVSLIREWIGRAAKEDRPALEAILNGRSPGLDPAAERRIRECVEDLGADAVERRSDATAFLESLPEGALDLLEQARGGAKDDEVRARLEYVIGRIRSRDCAPVRLEFRRRVTEHLLRFSLRNGTAEPIRYYGYDAARPLYRVHHLAGDPPAWTDEDPGWCGTGVHLRELHPGAEQEIESGWEARKGGPWRLALEVQVGARTILVCSDTRPAK